MGLCDLVLQKTDIFASWNAVLIVERWALWPTYTIDRVWKPPALRATGHRSSAALTLRTFISPSDLKPFPAVPHASLALLLLI